MFQTLVNVDARLEHIWRRILQDDYSEPFAQACIASTRDSIVDRFHGVSSQQSEFRTLKEIFLDCFTEFFTSAGLDYSPHAAAAIYMDEHNNADIYDDSLEFIRRAKKRYRVCVVSDADAGMIESHIAVMRFHDVFISESVRSYKGNPDGRMFQTVPAHYEVAPERVLHIGDSSSDINGATRVRMDTCWINRHNYAKHFEVMPTYEVASLASLYPVLKI